MPFIGLLGGDGLEVCPERVLADEAAAARDRVVADFRRRLEQGELVASGIDPRARIDSPRVTIPAERWRLLRLNVCRSTAKGGGFELVDVMVGLAQAPLGAAPTEAVQERPVARVQPQPSRSATSAELIRDEIRRRSSAGLLTGNWYADSQEIHAYLTAAYPERDLPQWKSIKRRYGEDYRRAVEDNNRGQEEDTG